MNPQYTLLKAGDVVQPGDEFRARDGVWLPADVSRGHVIRQSDLDEGGAWCRPAQVPIPPLGPEYEGERLAALEARINRLYAHLGISLP